LRIVIIGQGYVGLPVAMRAVDAGHDVIGLDIDDALVARLCTGVSHVEDVPPEMLREAIATGRYRATTNPTDCAGFHVGVISVPTPLTEGVPDLTFVENAAELIAPFIIPGSCVVLESTTYPGTTEDIVRPILEKGSSLFAGIDFHLGYSPERIDPGNERFPFEKVPKIVSGIDRDSLSLVRAFYDTLVETTVPVSSPRIAEMVKLLENTFRHVNIALVNEFTIYANELDIDIWETIDAAATKPFGFMRFTPGPGVGGHCLPVDPSYLSWQVRRRVGTPFRFIELANEVNQHMPEYVVGRLVSALNREGKCANGSRLLLLGLAYKPNTSDMRESPAARVATLLAGLSAEVRVVDPFIRADTIHDSVTSVTLTADEIESSDAVIVLTDHDAFDYDLVAKHARYVLDTRCRVHGENVEHL
jgi:UDP-N-acetyl-D-glucosamine dehydrogenase